MKKTVEQQIWDFMQDFGYDQLTRFLEDIIPLFELFDIEDHSNWVAEIVGKDQEAPITMIRTVYLMSIIAENHSGMMAKLKMKYRNLHKRMEKEARSGQEDKKDTERHEKVSA